jgi:hypothetical protein
MNYTIEKLVIYRFFGSFEKEEGWLEQMSLEGWHLAKVWGGVQYTFEKGQPEKRVYQIDFRKFSKEQDMVDYLTLFADSGWSPVNPRLSHTNFYFYTQQDGTPKDIFSDKASKAQRYLRYAQLTAYSVLITFLPYIGLYATGVFRVGQLGYLTPGLWQMTGGEFWRHFLFETPFVMMRVGGGMLPALILLVSLAFYIKYTLAYKRSLAQG